MPSICELAPLSGLASEHRHDCDIAHDADPQVRQAFRRGLKLMQRGIAVLIQGETGTGKEVLARALHEHGERSDAQLVALNCASIPESLIESELFGYSKGAFSGALTCGKKGKVLQSDRGTLFLDEIGDMPYEQQTRLLRVISEKEVTPLGAEQSVSVDFALICATHQNLTELVETGAFREDLFYRIATGVIQLPPLRERTDRSHLLCNMIEHEIPGCDPLSVVSADVWPLLVNHDWPGNLRQMRSVIRYACAVMEGARIQRDDLPADFLKCATGSGSYGTPTLTLVNSAIPSPERWGEREDVLGVLNDCRWNMSAAARSLGICRQSLYRVLRRLGIPPLKDQLANGANSDA
ncbi:regulatory protein, Fis family [Pseudomonas asturiensis]|uniref:Regulatory protein, Fis family n=1 Tax=Pseudomonas asturiensis TaxID=1190415 RepID=A0A1M7PUG6_9PSED|nr:sigma 54-interacting transcriptional regulator [Pseudomonas asturiensis]SHN21047.1 regulatory protein, Fis family [Pseudomonas asturiensis]